MVIPRKKQSMIFIPPPVIWRLWSLNGSSDLSLKDMSLFEKTLFGIIALVLLSALLVSGGSLFYIVYTDATDPYVNWETRDTAFKDICKKNYLRTVINSHKMIRESHIRRANELCPVVEPVYQPTSKILKVTK